MSFMKRTLASFGIGSAKVDSVLHQDVVYPGDKIKATIHVFGGSSAQEVDQIEMKLFCRYIKEVPAQEAIASDAYPMLRASANYTLASWALPTPFVLAPGEEREFDVELPTPLNTPITVGNSAVWLETGLNITMAKDPSDSEILTVRPSPMLENIFSALESKGLRFRQVECEAIEGFALPFVQEFEFVPTMGPYHGLWRELEMVAHHTNDGLDMWFAIDRHRKGVKGMLASLLSQGELNTQLNIPATTSTKEAGEKVIGFLATL